MGIFSKLKKIANPGGTAIGMLAGNNKNYIGPADYLVDKDKAPKGPAPTPFDPGQRVGSSINGQSGVDQPSMRLGWTNGGYNYHNSPFNMGGGMPRPHDAPMPQPMPQQPAPPMSFGGGGQTGMGASGPGAMLQVPENGGSMPSAGAPGLQAAPTAPNPQMLRAIMLRNGRTAM
jgi:hypothetical protein